MYNILVFDDLTMNFTIVYMTDNLKVAMAMYKYYLSKFDTTYIKVVQEIQSNDFLLSEV